MVQLLKKRINAIHVYFKALVVHNKQIQIEVCPPMLFKKVLTTASRYKLMSMRNEIVKIEKEKLDSILNELDTLSKYLDDRIVELHSERYNWRNGAKFGYNIKESVDVDWKKLRDDFFDEHIQKDTGGYIHITTSAHDLFEWFKSKLSSSQNTVSNEGEKWVSVNDRTPHAWESGNWDGKRSDKVLCQDSKGEYHIAEVYEGTLDGSRFVNWYDSRDYEIDNVVKWKEIN